MADFIRIENLIFDYVKHEDGSAHRAIAVSYTHLGKAEAEGILPGFGKAARRHKPDRRGHTDNLR